MCRGSWIATLIGAVVCAIGMPSAQQAPQQKPFQSGVTAIEVDVVALRQSGEVVRGLRQQDFDVFEDGVPVPIAAFVPVDLPDRPRPPAVVAPNRSGSSFASNDQPDDGRVLLIVLDDVQFGLTAGRIATAKTIAVGQSKVCNQATWRA